MKANLFDKKKAMACYSQASQEGCIEALIRLARLTEGSLSKKVELLREAIKKTSHAAYELAFCS